MKDEMIMIPIKRIRILNPRHRDRKKFDIDDSTVGGLIALATAGEKRLIAAAMRGTIPLTIAIDIARTDSVEAQRELLGAYETKKLNHVSIRAVKRLMEQRRLFGKGRERARSGERVQRADQSACAAPGALDDHESGAQWRKA